MELDVREKQLLTDIEKREKMSPIIYIVICLTFGLAILSLVAGYRFRSKDGYIGALYFATIGTFFLTGFFSQKKLYRIIKKLKE